MVETWYTYIIWLWRVIFTYMPVVMTSLPVNGYNCRINLALAKKTYGRQYFKTTCRIRLKLGRLLEVGTSHTYLSWWRHIRLWDIKAILMWLLLWWNGIFWMAWPVYLYWGRRYLSVNSHDDSCLPVSRDQVSVCWMFCLPVLRDPVSICWPVYLY